jgi:hypothetical protein
MQCDHRLPRNQTFGAWPISGEHKKYGIIYLMSAESIEFRSANPTNPQEIGAIALVIARANAQRDSEQLPLAANDSQEADLRERLSRPHAWNYVAIKQEQIVGFALGYPRTNEQPLLLTKSTYHF